MEHSSLDKLTRNSVCLTGIIRLIDTFAIKSEDLTFTNVSPALWNMVESEIGFVAANLLSMGPLFGRIRAQVPKLRQLYAKQAGVSKSAGSIGYAMNRRSTIGGSGLMNHNTNGGGSQTVTASRSHGNSSRGEAFPMDVITASTNLEQKSEEMVPRSNMDGLC